MEIANALGVRRMVIFWRWKYVRQYSATNTINCQPFQILQIDVLDIEVSAGPGVINREFVEVLRSVEYSFDDARHMFDGRKAENIRIINVRGDSMSGTIEPVICCSLISLLNLSTVMVSMRFCTTTQPM